LTLANAAARAAVATAAATKQEGETVRPLQHRNQMLLPKQAPV